MPGRVKKVHGGCHERNPCSQAVFERLIGTMIDGPISLNNPVDEYRAILSEDKCYFGRVLFRIQRGTFDDRNTGKAGIFPSRCDDAKDGTDPREPCLGRDAGISCLTRSVALGVFLLKGGLLGMDTLGSDFDPLMIRGSRENVPESTLMLTDATRLPVCDQSIDAVVTDFPYGQSVCIKKEDTMDRLYADALSEINRVLKHHRRAIVVTHKDISSIAADHMTVLQRHDQRVHKSLTRRVLVLEKQ